MKNTLTGLDAAEFFLSCFNCGIKIVTLGNESLKLVLAQK